MTNGFQRALDHIRSIAESEANKGRLFERLMKRYFTEDPLYKDRFANVWLWAEWAAERPDFDAGDTGIDLVAEERSGGHCAIQCKCYAPGTRIEKKHLDSFISFSSRAPFTARLVVDTGDEWGPNAAKAIKNLAPACSVLRFGDLANQPFIWPDLAHESPEALQFRAEPLTPLRHQERAIEDVMRGFEANKRGKLIMACGTGKTFTALRIAEAISGPGGTILYLVPSIALMGQAMREWATQRTIPHRYLGVCSDTRAGHSDEDAPLEELEIPVTTKAEAVTVALKEDRGDAMTVIFCTYQSLEVIEKAQKQGAPTVDLALCDEAHRTTGVDAPGDRTSPFVLIHDEERLKAEKRLYMTATPRLYTEGAKTKAATRDAEVFSMDDPGVYGPEFYRLPFSRAVEDRLLSDYKVVVLALSEEHVEAALQAHLAASGSEINITDAAKIVGCWRALENPEGSEGNPAHRNPLKRAIAFTNTIRTSKRLEAHWDDLIEHARESLPESERAKALRCETRHVDGKHNALERKARIEWLEESTPGQCRILSNARCLTEGVNVPALDAVLFMSPRNSQIDIVQAVGRVMRKAQGKEYGYIILPIAVPANVTPEQALNDNERFAQIWGVLRALRSHDDRLDAEINQIDLNRNRPKRIILGGDHPTDEDGPTQTPLPFPPLDLPPGVIFAKIVERCGDRKYWETWAKDVADIFARLVERIKALLDNSENAALREWFGAFHEELRTTINDSLDRGDAIEMMAQHILTQPVFNALFEHYDFTGGNPVAQALDALRSDFGEFGLENETRDLEGFYESVRMRAQGLDNSEARQRVLMELYEKFFANALKKDAERLGIVYTPSEVVDFILNSANHVLREEFGRSLSDEGVHILDPFTGTGIFLVRLLQSALINDADLARKYRSELHANELILLAYYIAAIHIEEAYHGRRGSDNDYEPFEGIVLTDTFNLHTERVGFPKDWLPSNSERAERQQNRPIEVIVGNPPWSAGQRSAADKNPNVAYPELEQRVRETYAADGKETNKKNLYNSYKMAIRWASDRIGEQGLIAIVTSGSWLDRNGDSGLRANLEKEFSSIYVLDLRGNQRTQGERSRREGGKIFGQGSRAPVAITILARNPNRREGPCNIRYRDIGDYLTREAKLAILHESESIVGMSDWKEITPDLHHDWIGQRSSAFRMLYPMGTKRGTKGIREEPVLQFYSLGLTTARDTYIYNFSRDRCQAQGRAMVESYMGAMRVLDDNPRATVEEVESEHATHVRWDRELRNNLRRRRKVEYSAASVRKVQYRPFVKQHCYLENVLIKLKGHWERMFPEEDTENRAIYIPGIGSTKPFSALMIDTTPDLHCVAFGQCFPRYRYEIPTDPQKTLFGAEQESDNPQATLPGIDRRRERVDNISDGTLRAFRTHYDDDSITKDQIFDYIYGVLHAPDYRERFANDLAKQLPRVPFATDFHEFADGGRRLADLHVGYERCAEHPLEVEFTHSGESEPRHFRMGPRAMRFKDEERSILEVNEHVKVTGIPSSAHEYEVNGRTPLQWFMDRYRIVQDKKSGIVNDPNGWFEHPEDLITAIQRIVHVSIETTAIVAALPEALPEEEQAAVTQGGQRT